MLSFMLLEVTTGCKTLNYIRTALRTSSVVIGTKLARVSFQRFSQISSLFPYLKRK